MEKLAHANYTQDQGYLHGKSVDRYRHCFHCLIVERREKLKNYKSTFCMYSKSWHKNERTTSLSVEDIKKGKIIDKNTHLLTFLPFFTKKAANTKLVFLKFSRPFLNFVFFVSFVCFLSQSKICSNMSFNENKVKFVSMHQLEKSISF